MLDGDLVIDATVHGFDFSTPNRSPLCTPESFAGFQAFMHRLHATGESLEPGFQLTMDQYLPRVSAEALATALFIESDVDVAFYHHVPIEGYFKDGVSPLDTGLDFRELAPNRVQIYGGVDTFQRDRGKVFAQMERHVELGVRGFKFYPSNGIVDAESRLLNTMLYDDPERAYPFFEKARELGVKHLAFHKAYPVGPSIDAVRVGDVLTAAVAFPDLTFEIVHAGWAFAEETALEMMTQPNLYANLELSGGLIVRRPRQFAEMIGAIISAAGHERLLFASGSASTHVDPILRAFRDFEMPQDLQDGYGYPQITAEMKRDILGLNMARLHGLDPDTLKAQTADDEWAQRRSQGKQSPWSVRRVEAADLPT